jgi:hypothetical protein
MDNFDFFAEFSAPVLEPVKLKNITVILRSLQGYEEKR